MTCGWFVTGTDTGVGKTFAAGALLHAWRAAGYRALGMKPIAAGIDATGQNEDVLRLAAASGIAAPARLVNPYLFAAPIAPHVAAAEAGVTIDIVLIEAAFAALHDYADIVVVEGVGGFRVPLDAHHDTADLAVALGLPVILVVGLRLGCLNHALLTAEAIAARGLQLAGWIANRLDAGMLRPEASIEALRSRLAAPLLGDLPHSLDALSAAQRLTLPALPTSTTAATRMDSADASTDNRRR